MTKSLTDELAEFAAAQPAKPNPCRIARLMEEIGPEAAALLADMLDKPSTDDTRKPVAEIARFFAERGHDLRVRHYTNHRRRADACHCPKASA